MRNEELNFFWEKRCNFQFPWLIFYKIDSRTLWRWPLSERMFLKDHKYQEQMACSRWQNAHYKCKRLETWIGFWESPCTAALFSFQIFFSHHVVCPCYWNSYVPTNVITSGSLLDFSLQPTKEFTELILALPKMFVLNEMQNELKSKRF